MKFNTTNFRYENGHECTQVTAGCECGAGGYIRLEKHPLVSSKDKLKGQRLGQALWGALCQDTLEARLLTGIPASKVISDRLYYIEDEELRELLNDYLREL